LMGKIRLYQTVAIINYSPQGEFFKYEL